MEIYYPKVHYIFLCLEEVSLSNLTTTAFEESTGKISVHSGQEPLSNRFSLFLSVCPVLMWDLPCVMP